MSRAAGTAPLIELVEFGTGGVGKSTLLHRFIHDVFEDMYDPTLEDTYRKTVVINSEVVVLECVDIGGQEDYAIMHERASRTGDGFMLVYSVTSRHTLDAITPFHQMIKRWSKDSRSIPVVLIGNKNDLSEGREVSFEEGQQLAHELGCKFYETSAKVGTSVDLAYMDLARQALIRTRERAAWEASEAARNAAAQKRLNNCIIA